MLFTAGVVEISCQELPVSLLLSSTIVNLLNFSQKQAFFAIFANFKPPWKVLKASPGLSIARSPITISLTAGLIDNCYFADFQSKIAVFAILAKFEPPWQVFKASHGSSIT